MNCKRHSAVCPYCRRRNKAQRGPEGALAGNLFGLLVRVSIGQHQQRAGTRQQAPRELF